MIHAHAVARYNGGRELFSESVERREWGKELKERERKKKGGKSSVFLVLFVSPTQGRCFAGRLLEPPPPLLQL
jgi:hypothetical protein